MTPKIQLVVSACFMVLAAYLAPDCGPGLGLLGYGACTAVAAMFLCEAIGTLR